MKKRFYFLLFLLFAAMADVCAQAPMAVTYQAVLRDSDGILVSNRNISVRMSIRQGSSTGTSIYTEIHTATTNANGLYTLRIGTGQPEYGSFANIQWGNGPYYAVSETDPWGGNNYSITTSQQILSVPYALYAEYAAHCPHTSHSDTIYSISRDTIFVVDSVHSTADTIYSIITNRDTLIIINNDTVFSFDTLYNITNHYDTLYSVTNHYDTLYNMTNHYDTIIQRDTLYNITNHYDTLYSVTNHYDTLYNVTNHYDTIIQRDTLYNVTNHYDTIIQRDTLYNITNHYDTLYSVTNHYDTLFSVTNHYDTIIQRDTLYNITTHYDTIIQRDTLYNITNHYDTLYNVTNHYDTLYSVTNHYDTLYNVTNHYDTIVQRDTLYNVTNHYDSLYSVTNHYDTLYNVTNHYDTIVQRDTLYNITNHYDTLYSVTNHYDTLYNVTNHYDTIIQRDTLYNITNHYDTLYSVTNHYDTLYNVTNHYDTIIQRDTLYNITNHYDTLYSVTNHYDTLYNVTNHYDTIIQRDTLYNITNHYDTLYSVTNHFDTLYNVTNHYDTIVQRDTLYNITTHYDTIIQRDTLYNITNHYDTLYSVTNHYDTLYNVTNHYDTIIQRDTLYNITNHYDTLYSVTNHYDTLYNVTNHYDTIIQRDTLYNITTHYDTIIQRDTLYNITNHYDTLYNITNHYDTLYNVVNHYDTIVQRDTLYNITNHYDTLYSVTNHYDTLYHETTNRDTLIVINNDTLLIKDTIYYIDQNAASTHYVDSVLQANVPACIATCGTIDSLRHLVDSLIAHPSGSSPTASCVGRETYGMHVCSATSTFTWIDGVTYTASTSQPTYTLRGGNAAGCDSIIRLHLTINGIPPTSSVPCTGAPVAGVADVTRCESYTWINGITYTSSTNTPTYTIANGATNGCDSIVTLHLTINHNSYYVDVQTADNGITWIDGNTYTSSNTTAMYTYQGGNQSGCDSVVRLSLSVGQIVEGALPGLFSVSANRQVRFSKGNLQYQGVTNTWRFAENQYESIRNGAGNTNPGPTQSEWQDLFGWGTSGWASGAVAVMPYSTSTNNADYYVGANADNDLTGQYANADWGIYNAISNGGNRTNMWRTLTFDELRYLLKQRNCSTLNGVENARFCVGKVSDMNCLIIFPDDYNHPITVTYPINLNREGEVYARGVDYRDNDYSTAEWLLMEKAGAVLLPMTGYRNNKTWKADYNASCYWLSTHHDANSSKFFLFREAFATSIGGFRWYPTVVQGSDVRSTGRAVRLVQDDCAPYNRQGVAEVTACNRYTWVNGTTYTASTNTPVFVTQTANGCDSTVTLHLTINTPTNGIDYQNACDEYTWVNGETYYESTNTPTRTIANGNAYGCDSIVTLNLTIHQLSFGIDAQTAEESYTWIDGRTYTSSNTSAIHTLPNADAYGCDSVVRLSLIIGKIVDGTLPGEFSVAADRKVKFSMGNLQYRGITNQWRFALHQYDAIKDGAGNTNPGPTQTAWQDLFGWGTSGWASGAVAVMPYSTSTNSSDYKPGNNNNSDLIDDYSNADWGVYNPIINGGNRTGLWRTLTLEEWRYLLQTRLCSTVNGVANARYCMATVNNVLCLIIFPDNYIHPYNVTNPLYINNASTGRGSQTYSSEDWQLMELAGAVCLPATGYRNGTTWIYDRRTGYDWSSHFAITNYWSSTHFGGTQAYYIYISEPNRGLNTNIACEKSYGLAVRLIKDIE